ncbi:hypothetical protein [Ralstonia syzygii]|uniref:SDH family Clp fold serine proteinase n=1 Tax=Ralstonia syzygii TaxID=28097 RepID=UPI0036F2C3A5
MLTELNANRLATGALDVDALRRKYLVRLHQLTGRPIIVYSSRWTSPGSVQIDPALISVTVGDVQGFMEVMNGIAEQNLDLIIHSPGGSLEGIEAVVKYLRQKFTHIRAIVPHAAMSAATMLATACDEIVLGKHSYLGPIDPQFHLQTPLGPRMVPAQAIIEQYEKLRDEVSADQSKLAAAIPMLGQYGPDLLVQCKNVSDLSEALVREWLNTYMLAGNEAAATAVAQWLGRHSVHKTHSRFLGRSELEQRGLKILRLEDDQGLQDAVLSVFHSFQITFSNTPVAKIIENHLGKMFLTIGQAPMIAPPFAIQLGVVPEVGPFAIPPGGPPQS